jgi:hypothetical protein
MSDLKDFHIIFILKSLYGFIVKKPFGNHFPSFDFKTIGYNTIIGSYQFLWVTIILFNPYFDDD